MAGVCEPLRGLRVAGLCEVLSASVPTGRAFDGNPGIDALVELLRQCDGGFLLSDQPGLVDFDNLPVCRVMSHESKRRSVGSEPL